MFFAYYYEPAEQHTRARETLDSIVDGDIPFGPLFTTHAVLSELATLLLRKSTHDEALRAVTEIRSSESFNHLVIDRITSDTALEQFEQYDNQTILFVDHTTAVLSAERDIDHVLGFERLSDVGLHTCTSRHWATRLRRVTAMRFASIR
jgi:Predicted nucleic acid-binding protein, contains PIN domain